jgi:hypothetical protein
VAKHILFARNAKKKTGESQEAKLNDTKSVLKIT